MQKHFVEFYSPGSFVSETTECEIDSWDIEQAKNKAKNIVERYGAKPYGFRFITKSRNDDELDSKVSKRSGMYYLGGKLETLAEVKARATARESILITNMECNGWNTIITNTNSYAITMPFYEDDNVLPWPD